MIGNSKKQTPLLKYLAIFDELELQKSIEQMVLYSLLQVLGCETQIRRAVVLHLHSNLSGPIPVMCRVKCK